MNITDYQNKWNIYRRAYEKRAFKLLRRSFVAMANQVQWNNLEDYNYKLLIELSIDNDSMLQAYYDMYADIGRINGMRVGRGINKEIKEFIPDEFQNAITKDLYNWLIQNVGSRITSVRAEYIKFINDIITKGLLENKTLTEITDEIQKAVKKQTWYRWQSMRIARTETTTAANRGAVTSMNVSGILMEKVWVSARDNRTRRVPRDQYDHFNMHNVAVGQNEKFKVPTKIGGFELLDYPGDPNGKAGDVINCRCTVGFRPKRDENGNLIMTR